MFYGQDRFTEIAQATELVDHSPGFKLGEFDCGEKDYNDYLQYDATLYAEYGISRVVLLQNPENGDVIAYMALCADSFRLAEKEKVEAGLADIKFGSVPALKIGKLAVAKRYRDRREGIGLPYGSFMLALAQGYATRMNDMGVACRFLVVDADTEFNPRTPEFYEKNGFRRNQQMNSNPNRKAVSMRYDIFTGTES